MSWKQYGATNDEGTCLWCGSELRKKDDDGNRVGDYKGPFCGLRCGYEFGATMAANGWKLEPIPVEQRKKPARTRYVYPPCPGCGRPLRFNTCSIDSHFCCDNLDGCDVHESGEWFNEYTSTSETHETKKAIVTTIRYTLFRKDATDE